jgi:hypothetical protein
LWFFSGFPVQSLQPQTSAHRSLQNTPVIQEKKCYDVAKPGRGKCTFMGSVNSLEGYLELLLSIQKCFGTSNKDECKGEYDTSAKVNGEVWGIWHIELFECRNQRQQRRQLKP